MRLDDGTRIHLADIRMLPDVPVFFGYIQRPGEVHPATALTVTEDLGDHGFPSKARIEIAAAPVGHGLGLDVTPVAFGPVLLRNDDGRTSRFPRAMVRCRADDGRTGSGWIEWNQPEPGHPRVTTDSSATRHRTETAPAPATLLPWLGPRKHPLPRARTITPAGPATEPVIPGAPPPPRSPASACRPDGAAAARSTRHDGHDPTTTSTSTPPSRADTWLIKAIGAEQKFGSVRIDGKITQGKSVILLDLLVNGDGEGGGAFVQYGSLIKIERVGPLLYFNAPKKFWASHATAAQTNQYGGKWLEFSAVDALRSFDQFLERPTSSSPPSRATRHRSPWPSPRSPATRS